MKPKAIFVNIHGENMRETVHKICDILDASPLSMDESLAALAVIMAIRGLILAKEGLDPHIYASSIAMNIEHIMQELKK